MTGGDHRRPHLTEVLLTLLAEHAGPLTTAELRHRAQQMLDERGGAALVHEAVHGALGRLQRRGRVRRIPTPEGKHVHWLAWSAAPATGRPNRSQADVSTEWR